LLHQVDNTQIFIFSFIALRIIQGIGSSFIQTTNYAIVSIVYPNHVDFAIGCLEGGAGIGLCFGPVIGTIIYEFGGYTTPFWTFALMFLIFSFLIKPFVASEVDHEEEKEKIDTSKYSYFTMISNRRILFANLSLIVNIAQYTFIDPILSTRMYNDFGYTEKFTSLMFFFLGLGYSVSCQFVHLTCQFISFRRCFFIFFVINGLSTMMYGPSYIFNMPLNIYIVIIALTIGGLSSSHTMIPTLPEILEAGKEQLDYPEEVLNDFGAGL